MSAILSIILVVAGLVFFDSFNYQHNIQLLGACSLQFNLEMLVSAETILRIFLLATVGGSGIALLVFGFRKQDWWRENRGSFSLISILILLTICVILSVTLPEKVFPWTLLYTVPISLVTWLTATILTRPVDETKLIEFYRRVHPGGPGWRRIIKLIPEDFSSSSLFTSKNLMRAALSIVASYSALLGVGQLFVGTNVLRNCPVCADARLCAHGR